MLLRHPYFRVTHGIHTVCYGWLVRPKLFICNDIGSSSATGARPRQLWMGGEQAIGIGQMFFALCPRGENGETSLWKCGDFVLPRALRTRRESCFPALVHQQRYQK
jgi:hypothetical protein